MVSELDLMEARNKNAAALSSRHPHPFPNNFRATKEMLAKRREAVNTLLSAELRTALPHDDALTGTEPHHPLFGRVVAKRGPFLVIRTAVGDAQALIRKERLAEQDAVDLDAVDLGDHVAVTGPLIQTKTGDGALSARTYQHVSKALRPPPDKWHGLADVEKRYRERYVDLFSNPEVAMVFRARTEVVKAIRIFLDGDSFLEVETPLLHPLRGGATAKPFHTHHNALDMHLYLRIAPELYLKRLLVGGLERVYEIGRSFRNEGISTRHNPEFTMLEAYMAYASFDELLILTENMFRHVDEHLKRVFAIEIERYPHVRAWWDNRTYSFAEPFARVSMMDAIRKAFASKNLPEPTLQDHEALFSDPNMPAALKAFKLSKEAFQGIQKTTGYGTRLFALYEYLAEPLLPQLYKAADGKSLPVFVTDHPFEISPLARKNDRDPRFTDRFELFIEGKEVANAFSELNDPHDQASRFNAQLTNREKGDEEAMDFDADYIRALEHGMPPAGGLGLGIDRMVMMLTGQASIRDVLLFPLLKSEPALKP